MKFMKKTLSDFIRILMGILFISLVLRASTEEKNCAQNLSGQGSLVVGGLLGEERYLQTLSWQGRLILVIFDFESLSCPLCLDSFKNFCEALQSKGQENSAVGILTYKNPEDEKAHDNYTKIIEKKLRGFIIGNNIEFPILLDKFHIFEGMNLKEAAIFLFDFSKGMLKKYTLPLTKKQLEEIFSVQKKD
jgi:hypothetical protein